MTRMYRLRRVYNHKRREPTKEAKMLGTALKILGIPVRYEVWDKHKHIDLAIPSAHIDIEVDGMQHLTSARQILSDLSRSEGSNKLGYQTIHIHNEEIHEHLDEIASALAKAARTRMEGGKV